MRPNAVCVLGAAGLPQEFFCKYKLWKGHFGAILKTTEKKKAK